MDRPAGQPGDAASPSPAAAELERLVAHSTPRWQAMARRIVGDAHEAEDVVQETLAQVWRRIGAHPPDSRPPGARASPPAPPADAKKAGEDTRAPGTPASPPAPPADAKKAGEDTRAPGTPASPPALPADAKMAGEDTRAPGAPASPPAPANLPAYLTAAVRMNALKRRARRRTVASLDADPPQTAALPGRGNPPAAPGAGAADGDDDSAEPTIDPLMLERALQGLPAPQQAVIRMRYYTGMTFQQISATLSISINTAASRCRYALASLRKQLGPRDAQR